MSPVDQALAERQAELVRALVERRKPPAGFDAERLGRTGDSLIRKRAREAARAFPGLARTLGDAFAERFAAFARNVPPPSRGGPLADARAFARSLAAAGELPDAGRLEALGVDLRFATVAGSLVPRRGPAIGWTTLPERRRLVVAIRCWGLGERWITVPWPFPSSVGR
jgi:hypothetical protein